MSTPLLNAALEYAARGWRVLPLHTPDGNGGCSCRKTDCPSVGKHPRTLNGVKGATTDADVIRHWWETWPGANVGIATGKDSGIAVLDVDPGHGGDESLDALEAREGRLPDTVESETGGGGRHILFVSPEDGMRNRVGMEPGLDIRADGGYIVAPPSRHASGKPYEWELSSVPGEVEIAPMPSWLLAMVADRASRNGNGARNGKGDRPHNDAGPIPEGQRNQTLASLAGTMRRRGFSEEAIREALLQENEKRCDPPLPASEVERIAASIANYTPDPDAVTDASLPQIVVNRRQDRELLREARSALRESDRNLFYRDPGRLVRLHQNELRVVTRGEIHEDLARAASWVIKSKEDTKAVPVPKQLLSALLEAPGDPIPFVERVVRIPAFVGPSFEFVNEPGYDAASKTLYVGEPVPIDPIPATPSRAEVVAARETLDSFLAEFTFTSATSRSQALGLLFTLLARPAITARVPLHLVEAATPGTGKTTLAEVLCLAAYGEAPVSMAYTRDGEEMGKRVASHILSGRAVIFLDDVARITGDPAHILSSLVTTGAIEVRAMRELRAAGGRWDGVIITTGNNVALAEEMPRKICRIRLDSPEDPWTRRFERHDLHQWTLDHRAEIVKAVAIVVNAWKAAGRPAGKHTRPSFGAWAGVIGGIVARLDPDLGEAFLDPHDVADMMSFGEGIDELRRFVAAWAKLPSTKAGQRVSASELVSVARAAGVLETTVGDGNQKSQDSRMGRYLRDHRGKVVDGFRIDGEQDRSAGAMRWKLTRAASSEADPI